MDESIIYGHAINRLKQTHRGLHVVILRGEQVIN